MAFQMKGGILLFQIAGYLGFSTGMAKKIVDVIDAAGWAFVAVSTIMAILSAGGLAVTSAMIDYAIINVKDLLKRNLKAQAIVW